MGFSSHSSESQEDAAHVGEMQNQHLAHVSLEKGTMKLSFLKEQLQQYFLSLTEKYLSNYFFLVLSCQVSVALLMVLVWT